MDLPGKDKDGFPDIAPAVESGKSKSDEALELFDKLQKIVTQERTKKILDLAKENLLAFRDKFGEEEAKALVGRAYQEKIEGKIIAARESEKIGELPGEKDDK